MQVQQKRQIFVAGDGIISWNLVQIVVSCVGERHQELRELRLVRGRRVAQVLFQNGFVQLLMWTNSGPRKRGIPVEVVPFHRYDCWVLLVAVQRQVADGNHAEDGHADQHEP